MMNYKTKKQDELKEMLKLRQDGMPYADIGKRYGLSYEGVRRTLFRYFPKEIKLCGSADGLTAWQKEFIRMHAGLIPRKQIAKHLCVWERAVADYLRRHRLEQNCQNRIDYRKEITDITRFQICVCDFEGYLPEAIGNLYYIRPERVVFLLDEMKDSGEYGFHIGKFEISNEGAYNKAKRRQQNEI